MPSLDCPEGYCSFDAIAAEVEDRGWERSLPPAVSERLSNHWSTTTSFFRDPAAGRFELAREITGILGPKLISGEIRAAAILHEGKMAGEVVSVHPRTWLLRDDQQFPGRSPIEVASFSQNISILLPDGTRCQGRAIISLAELARALGVTEPPQEPKAQPRELSMSSLQSANLNTGQSQPDAGKGRRSPGGRPTIHDWDAFWIEVALYAARHDLVRDRRPELQRYMQEWAANRSDDRQMDDSTIREKLRSLFERVQV